MNEAELDQKLEEMRLDEALTHMRAQDEAPKPIPPSKADSAMRGATRGATMGFGDELYGALGAVVNPADMPHEPGVMGWVKGIPERYAASRDYAREKDNAAQAANPKTFMAGDLVGSAGPTMIGAGPLGVLGRGAAQGAVSGAGNSTAQPFTSPDELEKFGWDIGKGGVLGLGAAAAGKLLGAGMSKLAPSKLKQVAEEKLLKAAGGGEESGLSASLLGKADEAGEPVVGFASSAKDIGKAARAKQQFFEEQGQHGDVWQPFGGPRSSAKEILGGHVDLEKIAASRAKARLYQEIADSAESKAAAAASRPQDNILSAGTFLTSMMHGGNTIKSALMAGAVKGGTTLARDRGDAFMGRAAQGLGEGLESAGNAWRRAAVPLDRPGRTRRHSGRLEYARYGRQGASGQAPPSHDRTPRCS